MNHVVVLADRASHNRVSGYVATADGWKEAHDVDKCHSYDSWEYEDIYWQGMSGPAVCGQWKNPDACVLARSRTFV